MHDREHKSLPKKSKPVALDLFLGQDYLTLQESAHIARVNKYHRDKAVAEPAPGPYRDAAAFYRSNIGFYRSRQEFTDAWAIYHYTVNLYHLGKKKDFGSAVLYKIRDTKAFVQASRLDAGRLYTPRQHTWGVNIAWVLAQMHHPEAPRDFNIISSLGDGLRTEKRHQYSALTHEIASALKANYEITDIDTSYDIFGTRRDTVRLAHPFTDSDEPYRLHLRDINPTRQECVEAVKDMKTAIIEKDALTLPFDEKMHPDTPDSKEEEAQGVSVADVGFFSRTRVSIGDIGRTALSTLEKLLHSLTEKTIEQLSDLRSELEIEISHILFPLIAEGLVTFQNEMSVFIFEFNKKQPAIKGECKLPDMTKSIDDYSSAKGFLDSISTILKSHLETQVDKVIKEKEIKCRCVIL